MQTKPGSIVVGVDGSPHADRALTWATRQSLAEHRSLTIAHTVPAPTMGFMDAAMVDGQTARSDLDMDGQKVLDEARSKVEGTAPELEVHTVLDVADPREVLLHLADDAAMLVVGSRGRGRLRSLLLGSVSVALVRHAPCPVVVVRPDQVGTVRNGIVVGADATPESRTVLEFAYRQASLHDLPLTVLDCVTYFLAGTMGAYMVPTPADVEDERLALAESMAGMTEKYPEVDVTTTMAKGTAHEALVRLGERMDLIVVGAHQNSRTSQALFGSVSVAVVENATCPVVVVPLPTQEVPSQHDQL